MANGDEHLAKRATLWRDSRWWKQELELPASLRLHRPQRDHWFRWEDELRRFAASVGQTPWQELDTSFTDAFADSGA